MDRLALIMAKHCEICGSDEISYFLGAKSLDFLLSETYAYWKCERCGFVFLNNQPVVSGEPNIYDESGYYSRTQHRFSKLLNGITRYFYKWRCQVISRHVNKRKGVLLDVGCGKGKFLVEAMKHGWKTFGIEPTRTSFEVAKGYGLEVIAKTLFEVCFAPKTFDVVTLWHVFEHIRSPGKVLSILNTWLKDDGLVVIAVPNIESLQAKFGKALWFNLDPPRHLYHFSPKTLKLILEKNGFDVKHIIYFYPELNQFGFIQTFLNKIGISPNIIFNYLKNNKKGLPQQKAFIVFNLLYGFIILLLFGVPVLAISFLEQVLKRGGSIVVIANKK